MGPNTFAPAPTITLLPKRRMPLSRFLCRPTQGDALVKRDVAAYFSGFANHNTKTVINEEAWPDNGAWMDLNTGKKS